MTDPKNYDNVKRIENLLYQAIDMFILQLHEVALWDNHNSQ